MAATRNHEGVITLSFLNINGRVIGLRHFTQFKGQGFQNWHIQHSCHFQDRGQRSSLYQI